MRVALGRIHITQAFVQAKKGNAEAQKSFDIGLEFYRAAARLGSGHASYMLGAYYKDGAQTKDQQGLDVVLLRKDLTVAWENYLQSAKQGDPGGLTAAALSYLLPAWSDRMATEDRGKGLGFLDSALKSDFPHAYFVSSMYKLHGKGMGGASDRAEAIRQLGIASCKGNKPAKEYLKKYEQTMAQPVCTM